jgi:GT2 family glycosyltransferase
LKGSPFDLKLLLTTRLDMPQTTVFWRRAVWEQVGDFDEALHYVMDYDYWLRMVVAGFQPVYLPGARAAFRMHHASKTSNEQLAFWRDWQAILRKIYAMPDLPPAIARLKRDAFAYVNLYGVDLLWAMGKPNESRPLLREMIRYGTWRPRGLGIAMYVDTYLHLGLTRLARAIYSRLIETAR